MPSLGKRLRAARERKKLKQTEVKEKTGINNKTLSGYENGVSEPDAETLRILANLYDVTTDYLLGREKQSNNDQAKNDELSEILARLPQDKKRLVIEIAKNLLNE